MSNNTAWTRLDTLNLCRNKICETGAEHLSKNTSLTHLHTFNLSSNQIGEKGAENLSKNTILDSSCKHFIYLLMKLVTQELNILSKNTILDSSIHTRFIF